MPVSTTNTARQKRKQQLEWAVHLAIWLFAIFTYGLVFLRFMPLSLSLLRGVTNVLPMALLFYLNLELVNRLLEKRQYVLYFLIVTVIVLLLAGVRAQINLLFPEMENEFFNAQQLINWRIGALATNIGVVLISTMYQLLVNRYRQEQQTLEIIHIKNEAQLQFLRAQINPHFLFNTLNNIYSLALVRSDKAAAMVLKLSNLLRYVVYDGQENKVALAREIEQIREFIELFQLRNEYPLDIRFDISGNPEGILLEPMILIPIVENSFKHCDFDTNERAFAHFSLLVKAQALQFTSRNSKNGHDRQKDQVGGVGLGNIKQRLELLYPHRHKLTITDSPQHFEVSLWVSFHNQSKV